jgi:hypothetical protein
MLLTITTTHRPAHDLGYLLHKHPERFRSDGVSPCAAKIGSACGWKTSADRVAHDGGNGNGICRQQLIAASESRAKPL